MAHFNKNLIFIDVNWLYGIKHYVFGVNIMLFMNTPTAFLELISDYYFKFDAIKIL